MWLSILKTAAKPSPMSTTPAFSPGPCTTRGASVGNLREVRSSRTCRSSARSTSPRRCRARPGSARGPGSRGCRSYSSGLRPCSATSSGVIIAQPLQQRAEKGPAVEVPSSGSIARSGCGISPSTLRPARARRRCRRSRRWGCRGSAAPPGPRPPAAPARRRRDIVAVMMRHRQPTRSPGIGAGERAGRGRDLQRHAPADEPELTIADQGARQSPASARI